MTRSILRICISLATLALLLGFAGGGWWAWMPPVVGVGILWLLGQWRQWSWTASMGLIGCTGFAATGLWLDLSTGWMLLALVAALTAWDLDHLGRRLQSAGRGEQTRSLERGHLRRLMVVDAVGLLLAILALEIEFRLSLTGALLLGLLAVVGLSQVVGLLRSPNS